MTEGGPFGKMGVGRCRALRRLPCPAPGPRPSPGRRCVGFRFAARSPIGVGDDGRGAIWEGGCWSMSGVEAVSVPCPWVPACAGTTVCRFSRHGHLHGEGRSGPVVRPRRTSFCRAEVGLIRRLTSGLGGLARRRKSVVGRTARLLPEGRYVCPSLLRDPDPRPRFGRHS